MPKYMFDGKAWEDASVANRAVLLENAAKFFLENNMMYEICQGAHITRGSAICNCNGAYPDFVAGDTCINLKIPMAVWKSVETGAELADSFMPNPIYVSDKERECLKSIRAHYKRVVWLIILPEGAGGVAYLYKRLGTDLDKSIKEGIEIWIFEIRLQSDGITLLSYRNIANDTADVNV